MGRGMSIYEGLVLDDEQKLACCTISEVSADFYAGAMGYIESTYGCSEAQLPEENEEEKE